MDYDLLNDPEFVAELDMLDVPGPSQARREFDHQMTIEEWAGERDAAAPEAVEPAVPEVEWPALTAATFVGLMCVGAAAAALVFHDRVARILTTW